MNIQKEYPTMRFRLLIIFLALIFLLIGCDSQEEVDEKVMSYIDEKLGFEVDIVYRGNINEGNMGDRSYSVVTKDEPNIEFSIFLKGIMNTEIVGNDYKRQKKLHDVKEKFLETYKEELKKLTFTQIRFENARGYTVQALYNGQISVFDKKSLDPIYQLIDWLHTFEKKEQLERKFHSLFLDIASQDGSIYIDDMETIQSLDHLQTALLKDTHLVVDALLKRDEALFLELGTKLSELGYEYYYGWNEENQDDHSVFCQESQLINAECTGGYRLELKGTSLAKENLFPLIQLLNNTPPLIFNEVIVRTKDSKVYFDDVKMIKESDQIDWYLK
jgi:hypothetical protein